MPGAFGTAAGSTSWPPRPGPSPAPTASTWWPPSPAPSPTRSATGPRRVVAYDFGIKRAILAPAGRDRHRRGGAGLDAGRRGAGPPARRRVPVQRPGRPGRGRLRRRRHPRAARPGARSSASASATSCWPAPSAPPPTSCPSAITAATTRCAAWRHGDGRDHQPEPQLLRRSTTRPAAADVTHVNLNDGTIEGLRSRERAGLQRAVPPRGRARAPRRPLPVRPVRRAHGERRSR